jgi:hypothetical protein
MVRVPLCRQLTAMCVVRTLLDFFATIPDSQEIQSDVLLDNIEWAKREKRIFLKQSLETRLIALYVCAGETVYSNHSILFQAARYSAVQARSYSHRCTSH